MKTIKINIYGKEDKHLNGMLEIESEDIGFFYSEAIRLCGMQSEFEEDTKEYDNQRNICIKISDLAKELI